MKQRETEAQSAICAYLTLRRQFFWRQNNLPAVYTDRHGLRQFRALPKYTPRGLPDIIVVRGGQAIFLEVKSASGRPSPDQIAFAEAARKAGAVYEVVRSIDDVQALGL